MKWGKQTSSYKDVISWIIWTALTQEDLIGTIQGKKKTQTIGCTELLGWRT